MAVYHFTIEKPEENKRFTYIGIILGTQGPQDAHEIELIVQQFWNSPHRQSPAQILYEEGNAGAAIIELNWVGGQPLVSTQSYKEV